ncbi:MAG: M20 family metallopeptidase [Candidatus Binataceae bacterium]
MDIKDAARERLMSERDALVALSHRIHACPELGWEEEKSSAWVAEALADAGFEVRRGAFDLPTAVMARAGSGPLHVAICAEYDALPAIGHACGHNVIAAMGVGAAIAAARIADDAGLTISLIGTPAEEVCNAGGKVELLERGAFAGVHAAMMVHPAPFDLAEPPIIAAALFDVAYTGKEAHASAFPERGINAADALTIAQTAIGLLRQHIRQTDRIHGIITKGGDAPNVVPAHSAARYIARAETLEKLHQLIPRVHRCFEAGAVATGAKLQITGGDKPYAEMHHDADLLALYRANATALGRKLLDPSQVPAKSDFSRAAGSTDMGNVSLRIPSIHPMIGLGSMPAVNHQPEFTAHCIKAEADRAVFDGALAMAWTAIDAAANASLRDRLIKGSEASR